MHENPATDYASEAAARAGFDLNLVECNLLLTPEQRLLRHDSALELAQALRQAADQRHAFASSAHPTTR